jgi:hypothetical protein
VRVRIGPGWNTTPSVFGTVISKLTANTEVIFVDCTSASISLAAGSAFVIEMVGNSTGLGIQGSYVAPPGTPMYAPQLYLSGPGCFADCGWRLGFSTYMFTAPSPTVYCTAKTNSLGCVPTIGFTGFPSVGAGSGFVIKATNVINNKNGLLFYGVSGQATNPFQGGTLCVKSPIKRTPGTNSGGNLPPNDCSGVFSIDMNTFASGGLGGTPLLDLTIPGTVVDCQWWGRDPGFPAPNNTTLSDGLEYTVP